VTLKKVELRLPEELLHALGSRKKAETKALQALLLTLIQEGKITASYAAEVLDLSYREMLTLMAEHAIPVVAYEPKDLDQETTILTKLLG
jgi:predicted HTH domain antitoxin